MELERDLVLRLPMVPYCVTYSAAERGRANGESRGFRVSLLWTHGHSLVFFSTNFLIIGRVWVSWLELLFHRINEHGCCMTEVTLP